jgi:radical SAM-linked protein
VKLRLRYAKLGKIRFTGHRDTARLWERATRIAAVPVATSTGFTPRPRLSFGLALPTGGESVAEYIDIELAEPMTDDDVAPLVLRASDALPVGFTVLAGELSDLKRGSLQETVCAVTWELTAPEGADVGAIAERLLTAETLPLARVRKGTTSIDDIRPQIRSLHGDGGTLVAVLTTNGRGVRPAELAALAFPEAEPLGIRALRTHQWIDHDGQCREVMPLDDDVRLASLGAGVVVVPAGTVGA